MFKSQPDTLDTLINEELFSRDGRESGVMLDTLIGASMFCLTGSVDMSDTLKRVFASCLPFGSVNCNLEFEHSKYKSYKSILRKYSKVLPVAILDQFVSRSTIVNRHAGDHRHRVLKIASGQPFPQQL